MKVSMLKGFSLVVALIFIVIIATVGMLGLSYATKSLKQTSDLYLKEQAEILARNATEFAVLAMQKHDYSKNCLEKITIYHPTKNKALFKIDVKLSYFDASLPCKNKISSTAFAPVGTLGLHPSSHTALVDVRVQSTNDKITPVIYTLQSIQKP